MNSRTIFENAARVLVLLFLQVFVFNYVHFLGFLNPNLYLLGLLLLPLSIPMSAQYLVAFLTGLVVDVFSMTYGVHASASMWLIFMRPIILRMMTFGKREEMQVVPVPGQKVFRWLFIYTFALVGIHQVLVTMLEVFTFRRFYLTLLIILGNALMTTFLILALEYIFIPISKKK